MTCRFLSSRKVTRRARRVDAEIRVRRLAAGLHGAVAADKRRGAAVEAPRSADAARRERPRRIRIDRGKR